MSRFLYNLSDERDAGMATITELNRETSSYSNCSSSPKRSQRDVEATEFERKSMISDDDEDCSTPRKKLRLSREQISVLEGSFTSNTTLNPVLITDHISTV